VYVCTKNFYCIFSNALIYLCSISQKMKLIQLLNLVWIVRYKSFFGHISLGVFGVIDLNSMIFFANLVSLSSYAWDHNIRLLSRIHAFMTSFLVCFTNSFWNRTVCCYYVFHLWKRNFVSYSWLLSSTCNECCNKARIIKLCIFLLTLGSTGLLKTYVTNYSGVEMT
jgi:hypothetical protein